MAISNPDHHFIVAETTTNASDEYEYIAKDIKTTTKDNKSRFKKTLTATTKNNKICGHFTGRFISKAIITSTVRKSTAKKFGKKTL